MRLTLRTLLAYLDDTLEPAQAKLIGQKVAESTAAQELIARIKEVVRRRRLTTPPPGGISDPNIIAEYIDSELPAERLAEVEEACLSSDVNLAEIAACHQILTVVLSEPILVPPTAKGRMYGLRRGRESSGRRSAAAIAPAAPEHDGPAEAPDATDDTLLLGLPLYPRSGSWGRRLAPILAVLVLAGALIAVIAISLSNISQPDDRPARPSGLDNRVATVPDNVAGNTTSGQNGNGATKPDGNTTRLTKPDNTQTAKANSQGAGGAAGAGTSAQQTGSKPSTTQANGAVKPPVKPINTQPPVEPASGVVGQYVSEASPHSILYQRANEKDHWQRVHGPRSPIASGTTLLSLPGSSSEIDTPSGVHLILWGTLPDPQRVVPVAESQVVFKNDPSVDADLTLERGRVAITNRKTGPAKVRLRFQREVWEVTLPDPGSEVIVERWGLFPPGVSYGKDALEDGPANGVALVTSQGSSELKTGYFHHHLQQPPGPALFLWDNTGGEQTSPQRLEKLQKWFVKHPETPEDAQQLDDLSNRLEKEDPESVFPQVIREGKPFARRVAVSSLAAIDDLGALIDALNDDNHRDVRLEAINAMRHWIGIDKGYADKLHAALERKFQGTGEIVNALLYTYSIEQLNDPSTWELLITYLNHPNLCVRELADAQLALLLPELHARVPYDPAGKARQRDVAVAMWKRLIPSGHLPPRADQPGAQTPGKAPATRRRNPR